MSRAGPDRAHQRTASNGGETGSSGSGGGYRSKAITRDLLLSVCRKHFALKTVAGSGSGSSGSGRSFKGQSQQAKLEYAGQHGEGYDYGSNEAQTKLETLERYLKRATHLQLDGLKLTHTFPPSGGDVAVPDQSFGLARNIRVLYLHANHLATLDDFSFCAATLSHLYLQNNRIARMENLLQLTNLEKLYIGNNEIQILEGFAPEAEPAEQHSSQVGPADPSGDAASRPSAPPPPPFYLVELHMDSQVLPAGLSLQLSIPSMQALSSSLTVLSLASNQMDSDSILPLSLLHRLTDLNLSSNRVGDLRTVAEMVSYLRDLRVFDLRHNPLNSGAGVTAVTHKKYRDRIIMSSQRIALLDGKDVMDNQREYLHGLMEQRRIKRAAAAAADGKPRELSEEERKFAALHAPPVFPYAPKVLTLRTAGAGVGAGAGGSIPVGMLGGMGAGSRRALHGSASSAAFGSGGAAGGGGPAYQAHSGQYQPSPFLDDDDSGGGGDPSDPHPSLQQSGGDPPGSEGTASSMTFTGDPTRLNDLLQQRGLVSAFTGMALHSATGAAAAAPTAAAAPAVADSARARRASMNSLNQAPNGWDGGRTQYAAPTLSRKTSQTSTSANASSTSSAAPSRTSTRAGASKPASSK